MRNLTKNKIISATLSIIFGLSILFLAIPSDYQGILEPNKQYDLEAPTSSDVSDIYTLDEQIFGHIWSPDGTQVAYIKCPTLERWNCELWVANKDSSSAQLFNHQLISSEAEYDGLLDWKDDWILYRIRREDGTPASIYGRNELWKIRANGTDMTQITFTNTNGIRTTWTNPAYTNRGTAVWGRFIPGTDLVYFHAHNGNGWYKTFVCNDDGTDGWYHISNPDYTWRVTLSPTGNKLLWGQQSSFGQPTTHKACNVDGTGRTTIKAFSNVISFKVLADGNTVIWSDNDNIYAIDIDGTNERTVLDDEHVNRQWNYNPSNGQELLMGSNRSDGNMHIYMMNVDGSGIEQLSEGPYLDDNPILSPDGQYLSYLRLPYDFDKGSTTIPYPYELVIKKLAPSITIDSPAPNQLCGIAAPSFSLTVDEDDLQEKWYSFDGGDNIVFTTETQFDQLEWDKVGNGTVLIAFYVKDKLGNINSAEVTVRKDANIPDVNIIAPTAGEVFGLTAPDYDVLLTDDDFVASSWYTVEGTITQYPITGQTGSIDQGAWDDAPEGDVTLTFYAEDGAGNVNSDNVVVKKDIGSLTVTIPDSLTVWEMGTSQDITWTSTGTISNVKIELYKGGVFEKEIIAATTNDGTYNWDIPKDLEDGIDYQIKISDVSNLATYDESSNFAITSVDIPPAIPSYNLYIVIGIICVVSVILFKKRFKLIK